MPSMKDLYAKAPRLKRTYWANEMAELYKTETNISQLALIRKRCLSCLLPSNALWAPANPETFDDHNRYWVWRSRGDAVVCRLVHFFWMRFELIDPTLRDRIFQQRLDFGLRSGRSIVTSNNPTKQYAHLLTGEWKLDTPMVNNILRHPQPDFIAFNRKYGWTKKMDSPDHFLEGALAMLSDQISDKYGFHSKQRFDFTFPTA